MTGKEFRRIREEDLCWTQTMLAYALHIKQSSVSHLESKEQVPQVHRLAILYLVEDPSVVTQELNAAEPSSARSRKS